MLVVKVLVALAALTVAPSSNGNNDANGVECDVETIMEDHFPGSPKMRWICHERGRAERDNWSWLELPAGFEADNMENIKGNNPRLRVNRGRRNNGNNGEDRRIVVEEEDGVEVVESDDLQSVGSRHHLQNVANPQISSRTVGTRRVVAMIVRSQDQGPARTIAQVQKTLFGPFTTANAEDFGDPTARGSPYVTGFSQVNGECLTQAYEEAKASCESVGARLCTAMELSLDETKGTGCNFNSKYVWSSSADGCASGEAQTVRGQSNNNFDPQCEAKTQLRSVRCCADGNRQAKTYCGDLGWGGGGSSDVCGESDLMTGSCETGNFATARGVCEGVGARLCTVDEIVNDETTGTGCQYDSQEVWTASLGDCPWGSSLVLNGNGNTAAVCAEQTSTRSIRCCADQWVGTRAQLEVVSDGQLSITGEVYEVSIPRNTDGVCNDGTWTTDAEGLLQTVYGISVSSFDHRLFIMPGATSCGYIAKGSLCSGGCSSGKTWYTGSTWGSRVDAYLHELGHNLGMHHSGQNGNEYADTSDRMGYANTAQKGYNGPHLWYLGWMTSTTKAPRHSSQTCGQLGWTNAGSYGSSRVCGESDPTGVCSTGDFNTAQAFCQGIGARLCTEFELSKDEPRGTGCSYDSQLVWSSSKGNCPNGEMLAADGASGSGTSFAPTCTSASTSLSVRCCADTAFYQTVVVSPVSAPQTITLTAPTARRADGTDIIVAQVYLPGASYDLYLSYSRAVSWSSGIGSTWANKVNVIQWKGRNDVTANVARLTAGQSYSADGPVITVNSISGNTAEVTISL